MTNAFVFNQFDVAEMLGITPVCRVSDEELWTRLVTPITRGLIGPIIRAEPPYIVETIAGIFPGDETTNFNDHRLYGGKTGFVRLPYIRSFYRTQHGCFIVKRDGTKVELFCWTGEIERGKAELVLKIGLRDRRFDGTKRANDSALVDYRYDDALADKQLPAPLKSCELSVYSFMPGSSILDATGEEEFDQFFRNPYTFAPRADLFLAYFHRAWKTKRAPGQYSAPIKDVSKELLPAVFGLLKNLGYDAVEAAPSHYHVARWFQTSGFVFTNSAQAMNFANITAALEQIRRNSTPMTRSQQSWACVLQSLKPADKIPSHLHFQGPQWPQTNLDSTCLWMAKPLSDSAKAILAKAT